jgi:AcrR family transcriptional regulator
VSKQTFYNHFESKDDLILAVLKHRGDDEIAIMHRLLDEFGGSDPRARLYAVFDVLHSMLTDPEFHGCIFITAAAEFSYPHDPAHIAAAQHAKAIQAIYRDLAERAGVDDPQTVAEQITILTEGALICRHVTGNPRASEIARTIGTRIIDEHLPNPAHA